MQNRINKETEGVIGLKKLQSGKYKLWRKEEIESSGLLDSTKEILYFIAEENSRRRTPWQKDIERGVSYSSFSIRTKLNLLKKREMAFSFTILEIIKFYGLDYLGYHHGNFNPPEHLEWLGPYLKNLKRSGSVASLSERLKSPRISNYRLYWIAMLEKDGLPCYLPLGLHIT